MSKQFLLTIIIIFVLSNVLAQNRIVKGQVLNESLEPQPNVIIRISDTSSTFECDENGMFEINIDNSIIEIEAIHIRFKTEKVNVENKCFVNIVLIGIFDKEFETVKEKNRYFRQQKRKVNAKYRRAVKDGAIRAEEKCIL